MVNESNNDAPSLFRIPLALAVLMRISPFDFGFPGGKRTQRLC